MWDRILLFFMKSSCVERQWSFNYSGQTLKITLSSELPDVSLLNNFGCRLYVRWLP